jgi:hypothetical protein
MRPTSRCRPTSGAHRFHDGRPIKHLQLADSKIAKNGVAILSYKPAENSK